VINSLSDNHAYLQRLYTLNIGQSEIARSTRVSPAVSRCDVFVMYRLLMQELQGVCDLDGEKYQLLTC